MGFGDLQLVSCLCTNTGKDKAPEEAESTVPVNSPMGIDGHVEGQSLGWGSPFQGAGIQGVGVVHSEVQTTPALGLLPLQVEGHPEGCLWRLE